MKKLLIIHCLLALFSTGAVFGAECEVPSSGNWSVSTGCEISSDTYVPADLIVEPTGLIDIKAGANLYVDLKNHKVLIPNQSGKQGGILIRQGGSLKQGTSDGRGETSSFKAIRFDLQQAFSNKLGRPFGVIKWQTEDSDQTYRIYRSSKEGDLGIEIACVSPQLRGAYNTYLDKDDTIVGDKTFYYSVFTTSDCSVITHSNQFFAFDGEIAQFSFQNPDLSKQLSLLFQDYKNVCETNNQEEWYCEYLEAGIEWINIPAYQSVPFDAETSISRLEFAYILAQALDLSPSIEETPYSIYLGEPLYTDIDQDSHLAAYYLALEALVENGSLQNRDNANLRAFRPNDPLTRAEAIKAVMEALDGNPNYDISLNQCVLEGDAVKSLPYFARNQWYGPYLRLATDHGILDNVVSSQINELTSYHDTITKADITVIEALKIIIEAKYKQTAIRSQYLGCDLQARLQERYPTLVAENSCAMIYKSTIGFGPGESQSTVLYANNGLDVSNSNFDQKAVHYHHFLNPEDNGIQKLTDYVVTQISDFEGQMSQGASCIDLYNSVHSKRNNFETEFRAIAADIGITDYLGTESMDYLRGFYDGVSNQVGGNIEAAQSVMPMVSFFAKNIKEIPTAYRYLVETIEYEIPDLFALDSSQLDMVIDNTLMSLQAEIKDEVRIKDPYDEGYRAGVVIVELIPFDKIFDRVDEVGTFSVYTKRASLALEKDNDLRNRGWTEDEVKKMTARDGSSKILANALENSAESRSSDHAQLRADYLGKNRLYLEQAHHVIPKNINNDLKARMKAANLLILHEADNGIFLPNIPRPGTTSTTILHRGSHPRYTEAVEDYLDRFDNQQLSGAILDLKTALKNNDIPKLEQLLKRSDIFKQEAPGVYKLSQESFIEFVTRTWNLLN